MKRVMPDGSDECPERDNIDDELKTAQETAKSAMGG